MSAPVKIVPPAFSAVFISADTSPVSSILMPSPSDAGHEDAFARIDRDSSPRQLSLRLIGTDEPPRIELAALKRKIDIARQARISGEIELSLKNYRESLRALESPFDAASDSAPLYRHLPGGHNLLKESLFETAVLSAPDNATEILDRLTRFIRMVESTRKSRSDIAKARLLKAYKLMQHTMSAQQPKGALLKEAYALVQGVRYGVDAVQDDDTNFYASLLSIELLARSIAMAHNRLDYGERNLLIERQREIIKEILSEHLREDRREAIASYISDSAILLARLNLWSPALERARTATSRQLISTAGAKRLLSHPLFDPFVDGARILSASEIKFRSRKGSFMKRLQAALALAHSKGLKESIFAGLFGLVTGFALSVLAGVDGESVVIGSIAGAALLNTINRLRNGWNTIEASYAAETGFFKRTSAETAHDVSRLVLWGGVNAATWLLPAALMSSGIESASIFAETMRRAMGVYLDFGGYVHDGIVAAAQSSLAALPALSPSDLQNAAYNTLTAISAAFAASSILSKDVRKSLGILSLLFVPGAALLAGDVAQFMVNEPLAVSIDRAYELYIMASGAFFLTNFLTPPSSSHISRYAPLFLPGAMGLSAEMGMRLVGQDPGNYPDNLTNPLYLDRLARSTIISAEVMIMLFTMGLIPLRFGASVKEALRSALLAVNPIKSPQNYTLPVTVSIVGAGLMSPLGGIMQTGMDVQGFSNNLIQGVAISLGLLPITLGLSGVLKGLIPLTSRVSEAWKDARGLPFHRALLQALLGYGDSFNVPYVKNRLMRKFTMDLPAAALRAAAGWDTNSGQMIMSSMNLISGNAMATSTWPEASATIWERKAINHQIGSLVADLKQVNFDLLAGRITDSVARSKRSEAMEYTLDFFTKAGQVSHFLHPFMAHKSLSDRLWPLYAITRSIKPPTYPQMPNVDFYANLRQMLCDSGPDELPTESLDALLEFLSHYAKDPDSYELLRPLVKILALSRNSAVHGQRIEEFFAESRWIAEVLNVDLDKYSPADEKKRSVARRIIKRRIKKRFDKYEQRVISHGRQSALNEQFDGLFLADGKLLGTAGK